MSSESNYVIAIDGPSAAGKSSISRYIAAKKGFNYLDTGSMYRAIAFYLKENGVSPTEVDKIVVALKDIDITFHPGENGNDIYLNSVNVSGKIRNTEIAEIASRISAYPDVRKFLLEKQRSIIKQGKNILEGRDTTTVVAPEANLKVYLTAENTVRANRRWQELVAAGSDISEQEVLESINSRDERDTTRKESPLKIHPDAVVIDTTYLSFNEVAEKILDNLPE